MGFQDDIKNKSEDLKGRSKEAFGSATDDERLRNEGKNDQASASVKDKVTHAADKVKEGVEKTKDKLTGH